MVGNNSQLKSPQAANVSFLEIENLKQIVETLHEKNNSSSYSYKDKFHHSKLISLLEHISPKVLTYITLIRQKYKFYIESNAISQKQADSDFCRNVFKRLFLHLYQLTLEDGSKEAYTIEVGKNYFNLILFTSFNVIFSAFIIYYTTSILLAFVSFTIFSLKLISDAYTRNTLIYTDMCEAFSEIIDKSLETQNMQEQAIKRLDSPPITPTTSVLELTKFDQKSREHLCIEDEAGMTDSESNGSTPNESPGPDDRKHNPSVGQIPVQPDKHIKSLETKLKHEDLKVKLEHIAANQHNPHRIDREQPYIKDASLFYNGYRPLNRPLVLANGGGSE